MFNDRGARHITICARKDAPFVRLNMNIEPCWIFHAANKKDSAPHSGRASTDLMSGNS